MTTARFPVVGPLDSAGGVQRGTVLIDREAGLVTVRPLRKKTTYTMPLSAVATMICQRIILNELREKRVKKAAAKKARRRSP